MLQRNYYKEGTFSRNSNRKWYTETTPFFAIHVVQEDKGLYSWRVNSLINFGTQTRFKTVEEAYESAVKFVNNKLSSIKLGEIE